MISELEPIEINEPVTYYGKVIGMFRTIIIPYIRNNSFRRVSNE